MIKPAEKQIAEATEQQRLQQSIQQTHKTAIEIFPGETWDSVDTIKLKYEKLPDKLEGIKIARSRLPVNKSQEKDLIKELVSARILKNLGYSVYLVPKMKRPDGSGEMPGPDAIVNGKLFEFKDVTGSIRRFEDRFRESRIQGKNVYFRIESPNITRQDIVRKLFGIINDSSYTGGYQGDIVFTLGSGKSEKTYFLKIRDLKKK